MCVDLRILIKGSRTEDELHLRICPSTKAEGAPSPNYPEHTLLTGSASPFDSISVWGFCSHFANAGLLMCHIKV